MQTRGVPGQKIPKNANVICERPLTLFQPEGAHYAHPITASTPRFQNLTTALQNECATTLATALVMLHHSQPSFKMMQFCNSAKTCFARYQAQQFSVKSVQCYWHNFFRVVHYVIKNRYKITSRDIGSIIIK